MDIRVLTDAGARRFNIIRAIQFVCNSTVKSRWRIGGVDVVGVDISGRHEEDGEYLMVAVAVAATIGSNRSESITGMGYAKSQHAPTLDHAIGLVREAVDELPTPPQGPIVAERGEFYEEPVTRVSVSFDTEFKYVESIGERKAVEAAHHAAYGARRLFL